MRRIDDQVKALSGTFRKDRAHPDGASESSVLRCPAGLTKGAKRYWRSLSRKLERAKRMTELDIESLADFCTCLDRRDEIEARLREEGLTVAGYRGPVVKHPLIAVLKLYRDTVRGYTAQFGMTPRSREQLSTPSTAMILASTGGAGRVIWPDLEAVLSQPETPGAPATDFQKRMWTRATGLPPGADRPAPAWVVADDDEGRQHELDSTQAS